MPRVAGVTRDRGVLVAHVFTANPTRHVSVTVQGGRGDTDQLASLSVQLVTPTLQFLLAPDQLISQVVEPSSPVPIWRLGDVVVVTVMETQNNINNLKKNDHCLLLL